MKWRIGVFCGERWYRIRSWTRYWNHKVAPPNRSFGPFLLYRKEES